MNENKAIMKSATSTASDKAKTHTRKVHGATKTKTGDTTTAAHKKVDDLAK
jgi:hypothetical protein